MSWLVGVVPAAERDGRTRGGIDSQVKDVAAAVMADRTELLAAVAGPCHVDLGVEQAFLTDERTSEYIRVFGGT